MLVSSLPLIELSLGTSIAQVFTSDSAGEESGLDTLASGPVAHTLFLDAGTSSSAGEPALHVGGDLVTVSTLPFYLNDYANEQRMQQEKQVQTMPTAELDFGNRSASHKLTRGAGKRLIRRLSISMHLNTSNAGTKTDDEEGRVEKVCSAHRNYSIHVQIITSNLVNLNIYLILELREY